MAFTRPLMAAQHAACLCSQFVAGMRAAAHWRVFRGGPGFGPGVVWWGGWELPGREWMHSWMTQQPEVDFGVMPLRGILTADCMHLMKPTALARCGAGSCRFRSQLVDLGSATNLKIPGLVLQQHLTASADKIFVFRAQTDTALQKCLVSSWVRRPHSTP